MRRGEGHDEIAHALRHGVEWNALLGKERGSDDPVFVTSGMGALRAVIGSLYQELARVSTQCWKTYARWHR